WSILGAVPQGTKRLPPMIYATMPTIRYHPAIVARKAGTMALRSDGRFRLGLGDLEQLHEHVVGRGYTPVHIRHQTLAPAVEIIRAMWEGDDVTFHGAHDDDEGTKLFDRPPNPPRLGIAESGKHPSGLGGRMVNLVIATEPTPELVRMLNQAGGTGTPAADQTLVCWRPDVATRGKRAHERFVWSLGAWTIPAEPSTSVNFEAFVKAVTEELMAQKDPSGRDIAQIIESVKQFVRVGFSEAGPVQSGQNRPRSATFVPVLGHAPQAP
ncbi:MAG TPA: TIGR03557 family F420-dependent LLM class oxidoreductase, partial [Thermomicrobiales bacterium]|nr:TIGR03557 family F420-dependent LLM class oxidoreductase [Thermomicrobiales bacterium]